MKKLISIILSLALVACMFGMSAMAAEVGTVTSGKGQIGSYVGGNGPISSGEESFNETNFSQAVTLTINGKASRYAVDIVFGGDSSYTNTVDGITWNVNTLKYEVDTTTMTDLNYKFTVTNYSDKPVKVAVSDTENNTLLNVAFTNAVFTVEGNTHGTNPAKAANDEASAIISPKSGTWADAINTWVGNDYSGSKTVTLATFTVKVSMAS